MRISLRGIHSRKVRKMANFPESLVEANSTGFFNAHYPGDEFRSGTLAVLRAIKERMTDGTEVLHAWQIDIWIDELEDIPAKRDAQARADERL